MNKYKITFQNKEYSKLTYSANIEAKNLTDALYLAKLYKEDDIPFKYDEWELSGVVVIEE
jgi:hypothetical protein